MIHCVERATLKGEFYPRARLHRPGRQERRGTFQKQRRNEGKRTIWGGKEKRMLSATSGERRSGRGRKSYLKQVKFKKGIYLRLLDSRIRGEKGKGKQGGKSKSSSTHFPKAKTVDTGGRDAKDS